MLDLHTKILGDTLTYGELLGFAIALILILFGKKYLGKYTFIIALIIFMVMVILY